MASRVSEVLVARSLKKGTPITLASGQVSDIYVDCKLSTLHGPSLKIIAEEYWKLLGPRYAKNPFFVAGVSVGGDPIVAAVILEAARNGQALEALLIRKEPKAHGASQGRAVDGFPPRQGFGVWLLEDVISTGGSSKKAAEYLQKEGYRLEGIVAIVDREMGGTQMLKRELGVEVESLVKLSDLH